MMQSDLETQLRELLDKQAITEVLVRYLRGENRNDRDLFLATFWPDSECHNQVYQNWPPGTAESPDAWEVSGPAEWAEKYWYQPEPPNPPYFSILGQVLIEVEDNVAYSEAYFVSYIQGVQQPSWARAEDEVGVADALKTHTITQSADGRKYMRIRGGRYCDRFERRDGVWKVAHRIVTDDWSFWHDCTETVEGLGGHPGLASGDDPLYAVWGARDRSRGRPTVKSLRGRIGDAAR
jgi:hypothetical protein